jgi:hypothetical protein
MTGVGARLSFKAVGRRLNGSNKRSESCAAGPLETLRCMTSPEISQIATELANVITRNAASAVSSRLSAIRARKLDQETMNELIELVNDLIADKNELIGIATAFEQELVAQRIADTDITYITTQLLPVAEQLAGFAGEDDGAREAVDAIKSLVTAETLTIMQLVGFNFRRAVGEPLTTLVERLILSRVPGPEQSAEVQSLQLRREIAYLEAIADPDARQMLARDE